MKQLISLIITFSTFLCYSQKHYKFDYLIQLNYTIYKDSLVEKTFSRYYFTNSKNNNFLAEITEIDSLNYNMIFKDENGLNFNVNFLKSDLNKAEFINIDCIYVQKRKNPFKHLINDYDFINLNDTIIDGTEYLRYELTSIKPKRKKRKKLGYETYIIYPNTDFHLPIFIYSTPYEEWKSKRNIPNGIFKERLLFDYYGKLIVKEEVIQYQKMNKTIVIDKECDYVQNE